MSPDPTPDRSTFGHGRILAPTDATSRVRSCPCRRSSPIFDHEVREQRSAFPGLDGLAHPRLAARTATQDSPRLQVREMILHEVRLDRYESGDRTTPTISDRDRLAAGHEAQVAAQVRPQLP